jgi:NAD(P)-dependent dehydrogenase (short-subunit alcohol dehydrogenase family)
MAAGSTPMRRTRLTTEVANTVLWLCLRHSSYNTAAVVPIDGGQSAGNRPPRVYRQGEAMQP